MVHLWSENQSTCLLQNRELNMRRSKASRVPAKQYPTHLGTRRGPMVIRGNRAWNHDTVPQVANILELEYISTETPCSMVTVVTDHRDSIVYLLDEQH